MAKRKFCFLKEKVKEAKNEIIIIEKFIFYILYFVFLYFVFLYFVIFLDFLNKKK